MSNHILYKLAEALMSFIVNSFLWELDVGEILHEYFGPKQHMVRFDILREYRLWCFYWW